MATKPLSNEAIAETEKKMDMTLDDIIKMSKPNPAKTKQHRVPNKSQGFPYRNQDKSMKVRQYMNSRSTFRQGALNQRRSNFQGNSFPSAPEVARKAAVANFRNRGFIQNRGPNWVRQRPGVPLRRQVDASSGGSAPKHLQPPTRNVDIMPKQKPKTLDSLFANMKEQRMRAATSTNNGEGPRRGGGTGNQPRQPWLRGRFGTYRN